jgi:hypothetical protein
MFALYSKDTRTDRERYLEDELEREHEATRERDRREEKACEQRRSDMQEQWRYEERQADDWPVAFQKQAYLCWREHNQFPDDDPFFKETALANEKALEIWRDVSASKQAELEELQKRIDAVWDAIRLEVAGKLIESNDRKEWQYVASALRDNELAGYLDW